MIINQPHDTNVLKWSKGFGVRMTATLLKAQKFVDSECIRLMTPYTPTLNTGLRKSAITGTKIGTGKIVYASPYARYQYYGKLMVSSGTGEGKVLTDKDLKYSKSRAPLAGKLWFERMKADKLPQIKKGANAILGGR